MTAATPYPRRYVLSDPALSDLGNPKVIIDELSHETRVSLDGNVWGMENVDQRFAQPLTARRYAESVLERLRQRAKRLTSEGFKRRELRNDALRVLGNPSVIVEQGPTESLVRIDREVWGFPYRAKTFLGTSGNAAMREAEAVMAELLRRAADREKYQAEKRLKNKIGEQYGLRAKPWGRK